MAEYSARSHSSAGLPEDGFRAFPVPGFGGAAGAAALIPRSNHE